MAVKYETLVKEDLDLGFGTSVKTAPAGGTMTGNKIGIHSLLGAGILNPVDQSGNDLGAKINNAIGNLDPTYGGVLDLRGTNGLYTISTPINIDRPLHFLWGSGAYTFTAAPILNAGKRFQWIGLGRKITDFIWNTAGYLFDVGATVSIDDVVFEGFKFSGGANGTGFLRTGRTGTAFDVAYQRYSWLLKNLDILHTAASPTAGTLGVSVTEYIDWHWTHVTINNFERPAIFDRGGNSEGSRVRFQGFRFGPKWTNNVGGCQDVFINPQFLGPATTGVAGVDYGYTVEVDAPFVTFVGALYEPAAGGKSQGNIHITSQGGRFTDINGALSTAPGLADASIVCDNLYDHPRFWGTNGGPNDAAMSFGTTAATGAQAEFLGCNSYINALASAQGVAKSTIIGPISDTLFRIRGTGLEIGNVDTINFGTDVTINSKRGMFWNNDTSYGIFRPVGAWDQPLNVVWQTGITLDPGASSSAPSGSVVRIVRGGLEIGTNPALTGFVRLPNNKDVIGRNAANGADVVMLRVNTSDQVQIGAGADIRWGKPVVALGGGAAPTLGTIGGSGPAAAAQSSWIRVIDSNGNAGFVPFWV